MDAGVVDRPDGTDPWLFMVFTEPVLLHVDDGSPPERCGPGTAVLWRPHQRHWFGNPDAHWSHSWIHCSGSFIAQRVAAAGLPIGLPIPGVESSVLERCIVDVHEEIRDHLVPDRVIVCNAIHTFLRRLARVREPESAIPHKWIAVRAHLEEHYRLPISLTTLARMADCSVTHLCDAFAQHFGVAPYRYLLSLRLTHARALLLDRSLSVGDISRAVGYGDVRQFTRLFRNRYGMPPSRMRALG
jgi:AraC-like DNA-binding protein